MVTSLKTITLFCNKNVATGVTPALVHFENIKLNKHKSLIASSLLMLAIISSSLCMGKETPQKTDIKLYQEKNALCLQLFNDPMDTDKITIPKTAKEENAENIIEESETYEILLAELTTDYPWDADSIIVSTPEDGRLGALSLTAKAAIIDVLYNFDYKILENLGHITKAADYGNLQPIPSFTLTFYHGGQNMHADFYQHNSLRDELYASDESLSNISFNSCIYWNECKESFRKVKNVIEQSFNTSLAERSYEVYKPDYMLSQHY